MNFFCVDHITAGYEKSNVIENISFTMDRGSITGILGANGSGKTTFLKSVGNILPHKGTCTLDGEVLEKLSARRMAQIVSYIPQRSGIAIDISALDVVLMGFNSRLGLLEHPSQVMKETAQKALEQVGLKDKIQTNYLHLSEGQKQLCILARTFVSNSQLLLLDEPESALDFRFRHLMLDMLRSWIKENRSGALVTLHDPMLALNYCDQLLLFLDGVLIGELKPQQDSLSEMGKLLAKVYGAVSLHRCCNHSGKEYIMMLKEEA